MDTVNTRNGDGFGGLPAYSEYTRFGTNYRSPSSIINGGISEAASHTSSASKKSKLGCWCSYAWIFTLLVLVIISLVVSNLSVFFLMRDGCSRRFKDYSSSPKGTLPGQRGVNEVDLGNFFQATRGPGRPSNFVRYTTPNPSVADPLGRFTLTLPPGGGRYIPPNPAEGPGIAGIIELEAELAPVTDKNPIKNAEWDLARRLKTNVDRPNFDLANRGSWDLSSRTDSRIQSFHETATRKTESWGGGGEWRTFSIAPENTFKKQRKSTTTPQPRTHRPVQRITTIGRIRKSTTAITSSRSKRTTLMAKADTELPDNATGIPTTTMTPNPLSRIEFRPPTEGKPVPVTISVSSVTREPKTARFLALHTPIFQPFPITTNDAPKASDHQRGKRQTHRLPGDLIPLNYAITWQPYLDKKGNPDKQFTFEGNVTITITCVEPTDKIILNSKSLALQKEKVTLTQLNDDVSSSVPIVGIQFLEDMEMIALELGEKLKPGKTYSLRMSFSGKMGRDRQYGLWYSPYITDKGWER